MRNGTICSFYSFKGGVGRSFLLANVAAALARWGYKVLCIDWDLEAPGLPFYFRSWMKPPSKGLLELIEAFAEGHKAKWRQHVSVIDLPETEGRLSLMTAGSATSDYGRRLQEIDWARLYEEQDLGAYFELLRGDWKTQYDFILLDSRTGLTDIGGICTIQLPEILVLVTTATEQSLAGVIDVAERSRTARNNLPYDLPQLLVLPVVSRFDAREEYERAQRWRAIFAERLEPLYAGWLEEGVEVSDFLNRTTIPYLSYWSFGEELPVVLEEQAGNSDLLRYHLETVAALLARRLEQSKLLVANRDLYVDSARAGESLNDAAVEATRARIAELRERLQKIERAREALGDITTDSIAREIEDELAKLQTSAPGLLAEQSPAAWKSKHIIAGDMIAQDNRIIGSVITMSQVTGSANVILGIESKAVELPAEEASNEQLLAAYLGQLARDCSRLPLGAIDTQFLRAGSDRQVALDEVYVDLAVSTPKQEKAEDRREDWSFRLARGEAGERRPLLEAVAEPGESRWVLLGDPGSGKSTFANHLCWLLATHSQTLPAALSGLLPVRFVLREVAARHLPTETARGRAAVFWQALEAANAELLGAEAAGRLQKHLRKRLFEKGGFMVFDGLDEVPEAGRRRQALLEAIGEFVETLAPAGGRFLVTARPYAYADPQWRLPGFPILALVPFDAEQVKTFVERWYVAARPIFGWSEETAEARARQLQTALKAQTYLGDLASRPLLLTLMATLHSSWGQLPEDRAELYEEALKLLLSRWQRAREVRTPTGELVIEGGLPEVLRTGIDRIRGALELLAFQLQERQRSTPEGAEHPADITEANLLLVFKPLLGEASPAELFSYLENRAGLLIHRAEGLYAFPHRSFQEYLAACWLAGQIEPARAIRERAFEDPVWWREVVLLAIGKTRRGGLGNAVGVLNALVPNDPGKDPAPSDVHWRVAALAGQALIELRLSEKAGEQPDFEAILSRVRRWLVQLVEGGHLSVRERLAAGDALGRLGDPRPGVGVLAPAGRRKHALPDIAWVEIPAGRFTLGSTESDKDAWDQEKPAHELELERFWISRYPITNAQFKLFLDDGGYDDPSLWTEEGRAWLGGAEADLSVVPEELRQRWADWLAQRPASRRNRPFYWQDARLAGPNRPVVGICWYESMAFACWLDRRIRNEGMSEAFTGAPSGRVRLPTEAEWEKAARGPQGRRWPWGDRFEPDRCNSQESGLGETSPVGLFTAGHSPGGVADLAGNVWEWTSTRWDAYPYVETDGREELGRADFRVIRGGSCYGDMRHVRCAARGGDLPGLFDDDSGFRVVLSLAISEY